jgi:hypothetical protein
MLQAVTQIEMCFMAVCQHELSSVAAGQVTLKQLRNQDI